MPPEREPERERADAASSASPSASKPTDAQDRSFAGRLLAAVVARPVAVTMCVVALAVFGGVSFTKLPIDLLPEISYPTLTVRTTYTGAAPEDVEDADDRLTIVVSHYNAKFGCSPGDLRIVERTR